jgi:hypothetical protein
VPLHHIYKDNVRSFLSGALASLAILFDRNKDRRISIALYLSSRGCQFVCLFLLRRWEKCRLKRKKHYASAQHVQESVESTLYDKSNRVVFGSEDTLDDEQHTTDIDPASAKTWEDHLAYYLSFWGGPVVMMLASSQILFAFLCLPKTLPVSYQE